MYFLCVIHTKGKTGRTIHNVGLQITRKKTIVLPRLYYLYISLHLLIGYPKEVLAGTSVAETTCAEMDVVQTGHSVYLRAKEECS